MKKTSSSSPMTTILTVAAGLAAVGATTYYFFGPNSTKNQKKLKGWMITMKGEIIEKLESAGVVTEDAYHKIIDTVAARYDGKAASVEVAAVAKDLKKHWHSISKLAKKGKSKK